MLNKEYIWAAIFIAAISIIWFYSKSTPNAKKTNESSLGEQDFTQNIAFLEISLQKGRDFVLYILMHSDGTINRSGVPNETLTGTKSNASKEVYMGQTDDKMLKEMLSYLNEELINAKGEHQLGGHGDSLDLMIVLRIGERGLQIKYTYGSESFGPPTFVKNFINKAIGFTDGWIVEVKKNKG